MWKKLELCRARRIPLILVPFLWFWCAILRIYHTRLTIGGGGWGGGGWGGGGGVGGGGGGVGGGGGWGGGGGYLSNMTILNISIFNWYCRHDCSSSLHQYASAYNKYSKFSLQLGRRFMLKTTEIPRLGEYFLNLIGKGRATLQSFLWARICVAEDQVPVLILNKTSYRKISHSLEAVRFVIRIVWSLWNLAGPSAALLCGCVCQTSKRCGNFETSRDSTIRRLIRYRNYIRIHSIRYWFRSHLLFYWGTGKHDKLDRCTQFSIPLSTLTSVVSDLFNEALWLNKEVKIQMDTDGPPANRLKKPVNLTCCNFGSWGPKRSKFYTQRPTRNFNSFFAIAFEL